VVPPELPESALWVLVPPTPPTAEPPVVEERSLALSGDLPPTPPLATIPPLPPVFPATGRVEPVDEHCPGEPGLAMQWNPDGHSESFEQII
jgi:hypothetical protein